MGCDIHLFAEEKRNGKWRSIDKWRTDEDGAKEIPYDDRFYAGRNYNLFAALCGVRSYGFNFPTMDKTKLQISKPRGIPEDACDEIKTEVVQWGSDGHSHNFNTLEELKTFDWETVYGDTCNYFRETVIPKMQAALDSGAEDVRIVYFFDN